jgi:hypothetical protein
MASTQHNREIYRKLCELNRELQFIRMSLIRLKEVGAPLIVDLTDFEEKLNEIKLLQSNLTNHDCAPQQNIKC